MRNIYLFVVYCFQQEFTGFELHRYSSRNLNWSAGFGVTGQAAFLGPGDQRTKTYKSDFFIL